MSDPFSNLGKRLEQQIKQRAVSFSRQRTAQVQAVFDQLFSAHNGKPADDIRPHVRQAIIQLDYTLDDADVTKYAERISNGDTTTFEPVIEYR